MKHLKLFSLVMLFFSVSPVINAENRVVKLVCEYHENPIGIDIEKPRLSWQILSEEQNVKQTAYEIRVANSPENLKKKNGLIWTSGKVPGDNKCQDK